MKLCRCPRCIDPVDDLVPELNLTNLQRDLLIAPGFDQIVGKQAVSVFTGSDDVNLPLSRVLKGQMSREPKSVSYRC